MVMYGWQHLDANAQARIAEAIVAGRAADGPLHLELHPTNRCNLNCFCCSFRPFRKNETLPWELMKQTLENAAERGLRFVRLSGGGESLLHPSIGDLLGLCERLGLRIVDLTTNATLLAPLASRFVEVGTDHAYISLNATDARQYAAMMRAPEAMFGRAIKGIEALCEARRAAPKGRRTSITIQFFFWRETFRQLPEMVRLALALGADQISIKTLFSPAPDERIPAECLEEAKAILGEVVEDDCRSGRLKLRLDLGREPELNAWCHRLRLRYVRPGENGEPDFTPRDPRIYYCYMGWFSAAVAAGGEVYPCCPLMGMPGKVMGNVHEQPLEAIWAGGRFGRFREEVRRLMLLRGKMAYSRRRLRVLEPSCLSCHGCIFSFYLCSDEFYQAVAERMEREAGPLERAAVQAANELTKHGQRTMRWLRSRHP